MSDQLFQTLRFWLTIIMFIVVVCVILKEEIKHLIYRKKTKGRRLGHTDADGNDLRIAIDIFEGVTTAWVEVISEGIKSTDTPRVFPLPIENLDSFLQKASKSQDHLDDIKKYDAKELIYTDKFGYTTKLNSRIYNSKVFVFVKTFAAKKSDGSDRGCVAIPLADLKNFVQKVKSELEN